MTDWAGFLQSNEFRDYRKKQIECVAEALNKKLRSTIIGSKAEYAEIRGQMDMAKRLLRLPYSLSNSEKVRGVLDMQEAEDMANITRHLMRKMLNG